MHGCILEWLWNETCGSGLYNTFNKVVVLYIWLLTPEELYKLITELRHDA
jgi:hypothetical protein